MRTDSFLALRLNSLVEANFSDIKDREDIVIGFGRKAKTRLGSIKRARHAPSVWCMARRNSGASKITINGLFAEDFIPTEIIDATIAHELCHYAHGFSSPLPQLSKHPHRGGVVDTELKKRGLADLLDFQNHWLKAEWSGIVKKYFPKSSRRRKRRIRFIWI